MVDVQRPRELDSLVVVALSEALVDPGERHLHVAGTGSLIDDGARFLQVTCQSGHGLCFGDVRLILVGLLNLYQRSWLFDVAGWAMLAGIVLFSGFLFAWLATGQKFFVYPVPVGGIAFICGWLALAVGALGFGQKDY